MTANHHEVSNTVLENVIWCMVWVWWTRSGSVVWFEFISLMDLFYRTIISFASSTWFHILLFLPFFYAYAIVHWPSLVFLFGIFFIVVLLFCYISIFFFSVVPCIKSVLMITFLFVVDFFLSKGDSIISFSQNIEIFYKYWRTIMLASI